MALTDDAPIESGDVPQDGREAYEMGYPPSFNPFCERKEIGKWITWAKAWIEASEFDGSVNQE